MRTTRFVVLPQRYRITYDAIPPHSSEVNRRACFRTLTATRFFSGFTWDRDAVFVIAVWYVLVKRSITHNPHLSSILKNTPNRVRVTPISLISQAWKIGSRELFKQNRTKSLNELADQ